MKPTVPDNFFICFLILVMDIPSDNVYAYALSKTLTKVSSPVTVGLYSECHNRINMVLKNIEGKSTLCLKNKYINVFILCKTQYKSQVSQIIHSPISQGSVTNICTNAYNLILMKMSNF